MSFQEFATEAENKVLGKLSTRQVVAISISAVLIAIIVVWHIVGSVNPSSSEGMVIESVDSNSAGQASEQTSDVAKLSEKTCVHIAGCVASPGLVRLEEGSRVADAIDAAGGLTPDASIEGINLARILQDGEQVIVISVTEYQEQKNAADTAYSAQQTPASSTGSNQGARLVNINTASSQELQTLSGIGESKASKIIAYRENAGGFKSIDELVNVSGIGEKTLESIRSQVCI